MIKYKTKFTNNRLTEYTNQEKLDIYFQAQSKKIQSKTGEDLEHYEYEQTINRKKLYCAVLEKMEADAVRENLKCKELNLNDYGKNYHTERNQRNKYKALSFLDLKNQDYILICSLAGIDPGYFLKKVNEKINCSTEYALNKKNRTLRKYRNEESKLLRKRKYNANVRI
jgi:hypothetical protein